MAIYDRFGRLIHGSEILAKDVLEYVVLEKHVANEYGRWRIHDKIIPDWLPPKELSAKTYKLKPEVKEEDEKISDTAVSTSASSVKPEESSPAQLTA